MTKTYNRVNIWIIVEHPIYLYSQSAAKVLRQEILRYLHLKTLIAKYMKPSIKKCYPIKNWCKLNIDYSSFHLYFKMEFWNEGTHLMYTLSAIFS